MGLKKVFFLFCVRAELIRSFYDMSNESFSLLYYFSFMLKCCRNRTLSYFRFAVLVASPSSTSSTDIS